MFQQAKNIDSAFKHIRLFTVIVISLCIALSGYIAYRSFKMVNDASERIYILANGKAFTASSSDRRDNIPVEARDHVKVFHECFFTLDPDEEVIQSNIKKSLYLADQSAKKQYDNLKENGYYSNLISGNVSQEIAVDSVQVNVSQYPYYFRCFSKQKIIRTTSIVTRSLTTEGFLRNVSRSDNNPHGFLIERWATIENKDLHVEAR